MSEAWVVLYPLDVVEFRDGRPFSAGVDSSARTTLPRPTSTAGAIGAAFGQEPDSVEGPLLFDATRNTLLFPAPADVVLNGRELVRLDPHGAAAEGVVTDLDRQADTPDGFVAPGGHGDAVDALLDRSTMERYLAADATVLQTIDRARSLPLRELVLTEPRTGLARDGRVARTGMLYTAEFLRFDHNHDYGFACRVIFDGRAVPPAASMVRLGGEARQAEVVVIPGGAPGAPDLPPAPAATEIGTRVLLHLVTPAIFTCGWVPDGVEGTAVRSACVEGPEVAASWLSGAANPMPAEWAVRAGSVYFLEFASDEAARSFVGAYHGRCLPQATKRLRTAGFGMCLTGRW